VDLDCCLTECEREQLHKISLQKPLTNILSSLEDLNLASVKISEIQNLIDKEQTKKFEHFKVLTTTWGSVLLIIILFIISICCSGCFVLSAVDSVLFGYGINGHQKNAYVILKNDAAS
jgi:hypothetical protein